MREFSTYIEQYLANGLRPETYNERNEPYLHKALNVRATTSGLRPHTPIVNPFSGVSVTAFPFPQLYIGEAGSLLLAQNYIARVNRSVTPWDISLLPVSPIDELPGTAIPDGGAWHIADMRGAFYAFSGACNAALLRDNSTLLIDRKILINTGTHYKGRIVVGGIDPTEIWSRGWEEILTFWDKNRDNMLPDLPMDDIGSSYVMWGSIGGGDFPLWLFDPSIIHRGPIGEPTRDGTYRLPADQSYAIDKIRTGQFGFMPIPYAGTIHCVKPLGNGVMVYGSDGISYLPHVSMEPAPTFGLQLVASFGIAGRGCVTGTDSMHVFMDDNGDIWRITADMSLNRLGYKEWFVDMLGGPITMSFNTQLADTYISDGVSTFVLTDSGLTEMPQHPTSINHVSGGVIGVYSESLVETEPEVFEPDAQGLIVTNTVDMNLRAQKTVTGVGVGISTENVASVAIDYRFTKGEEYRRTRFVPLNREGNAVIRVAGTEFRVVLHIDSAEDVEIDYIKLRWQSHDKRAIRGVDDSMAIPEEGGTL